MLQINILLILFDVTLIKMVLVEKKWSFKEKGYVDHTIKLFRGGLWALLSEEDINYYK